MGRDIRPTYAMGRGDRLKRLIIQAKVNNCLLLHQFSIKFSGGLNTELNVLDHSLFSGARSRMFNGNGEISPTMNHTIIKICIRRNKEHFIFDAATAYM